VKLRICTIPTVVVSMLFLLQWATAQMPSQLTPFSADMQFSSTRGSSAQHEMNGKIYLSREHMRMDMQAGPGGQSIMITNFPTKTADMLLPEQHMYMEFKTDNTQGRRPGMPSVKPYRDPSNPCAYDEGTTCKNLGVEQIGGRSCDHWQITDKNGKVSNVWIDQKLHFPIKTVSEDSTWQLTNIQEGEPAASLFQIPSDYHKMDLGGMMQGMHPPQQ
jgi:hypothetical protein